MSRVNHLLRKISRLSLLFLPLYLAACLSVDESAGEDPRAETVGGPAAEVAAFPLPDDSEALNDPVPAINFWTLLKLYDPKGALDRSGIKLNASQWASIKTVADEVCGKCGSNAERITALNDWVHTHVQYDYTSNEVWDVFMNRRGVCQGYANLLKAMLLTQEIPAVTVNGWMNKYYAHAWNYAYDGAQWWVCDPTNANGRIAASAPSGYGHLQPIEADVVIFADDDFDYTYHESLLNVHRVKTGASELTVPYSTHGLRIGMFSPASALPAEVTRLVLGANIRSLGENLVGLRAYPGHDEWCEVDPANPWLGSENGIVYARNEKGELDRLIYIPQQMTALALRPMDYVEKNTIVDHGAAEIIFFPEGTRVLESFAIEACPRLRTVYVPKDCRLEPEAICNCPKDVEVVRGVPTSVRPVVQ